MKRRILAGAAALVALAGTAMWVQADEGADAAPGDIDLEVTATGTYDNVPAQDTGSLSIEITNDENGGIVTTSATDVVVEVNLVTSNLDSMLPETVPPGTTYNPGTFEWDIPELDPGQTMTLVLFPEFLTDTPGVATVSPEVTATGLGQTDLDSEPGEDATIGNQDDEAVYRIQDVTEAPFAGLVWNDIDSSGSSDPSEPGVEDTFVTVVQGGETLYAGRTLADGTYSYGHLPNGDTDITFVQPAGFEFTTQSTDPDGSDPDEVTGAVTAFPVDPSNRDTIDAGLTAEADLLVEKSASATSGILGFTTTYEVRVSNSGPGATDGLFLEDHLPLAAELDALTITQTHGTATYDDPSDTVTWDVGQLLAGDTAVVTYEVTYNALGTFVNEAQVTASVADDPDSVPDPAAGLCADQAPDDDCASESVSVGADPTPTTDEVITPQGTPVTFNVLDNDGIFGRAAGDPLPTGWTWERLDATTQGSVTCTDDGDCTYTPVEGYAGADGFQYELTTPTLATSTVDVELESLFVNDAPSALDDQATTGIDTDVVVDVLANDTDTNIPPDTLTITGTGTVSPGGAGTMSCPGAEACTFDPDPNFVGEAQVDYTIEDSGDSDPRVEDLGVPGGFLVDDPQSDTATVTVVVDPDTLVFEGFTGATGGTTTAEADPWTETTSATATATCVTERPQITVDWTTVDRADGYRVERRPTSTTDWILIDEVDAPTVQLVDDLVGEGVEYEYQVTPLVARWIGSPSPAATETTPVVASPIGC